MDIRLVADLDSWQQATHMPVLGRMYLDIFQTQCIRPDGTMGLSLARANMTVLAWRSVADLFIN
jgi:hypothetical protein